MKKINVGMSFWAALIILGTAIAVEGVCMANYSALSWTFHQKEYWTAVLEITAIWAILVSGHFVFKKKQNYLWPFVAIVILLFCYIHQYLIAILLGGIYTAFIYLVGYTLCDKLHLQKICKTWQVITMLGISGVFVLIAIASLFKVGTPEKLRIIIPCIAVVLVIVEHRYLAKCFEEKRKYFIGLTFSRMEYFILCGVIAFVLIQVGRANIALDYDSSWYGLRSEYMLAPKTGIYDAMPFLACVHTYAKGIETLTLPLSGLGSFGIVYSLNIIFGIATIKCVYDICVDYCGKTAGLLATLFTSAIPGIMNMTVTAKSDILTLFLEVVSIFFLLEGIKKKKAEEYVLALAACVLSYAFKSSSAIFSTVIILICVLEWFVQKPVFQERVYKSFLLLGCVFLGLGVIWARTWLMTGTPFTFLLPGLIRVMGGEIKYPYEFYSVGSNSITALLDARFLGSRLLRVLNILFYPVTAETSHIIIAWAGPVFALLWIIVFFSILTAPYRAWKNVAAGNKTGVVYILFIAFSILSFGCILVLSIPDGNYFMLLYVVTVIAAIYLLKNEKKVKCTALLGPAIISAMLFTTASNGGWALGFTTPSLTACGFYDSGSWTEWYMDSISLGDIYHQLKAEDKPRIEIFSDKMQYTVFIPATTDIWPTHRNFGMGTTLSAQEYLKYLQFSEMDYLLIDYSYINSDLQAKEILAELAQDGYLEMCQNNDAWALVKVKGDASGEKSNDVIRFINGSKVLGVIGVYDDNWASQTLELQVSCGEETKLVVDGYYPYDAEDNCINIFVDGEFVGEYKTSDGKIALEVAINSGIHSIQLKSDTAIVATPPDIRTDLAFILLGYDLQ